MKTKIDTSSTSAQGAALDRLEDLLEALFTRPTTDSERRQLETAYEGWRDTQQPVAQHNATPEAHSKPLGDDQGVRSEALDVLRQTLDEAPRPRYAAERDWRRISEAYEAWKSSLGPRELHGFRTEQQALRAKVIQSYEATPQALALDAVERHRAHYHYVTTERGRRAARNEARRASALAAVATAPQGRYKARLREPASRALGRVFDESDPRVWKAPEAAA
jgi:hypothetical protein